VEDYLAVDAMELSIGTGLLSLADPARGGNLMEMIGGVRNAIAQDIGIILPKVRVRDTIDLGELQYEIGLSGVPVDRGQLYPDRLLAMDSGATTGVIEGEATRDPTFGEPAVWIEPMRREQAAIYGYTIAPPVAVLTTHLQEIARRHADELLTRDATKQLIDELKEVSPAVVDELVPGQMKLSEVQQVLQMLLREDVPIRQLGIILETLGDYISRVKDPVLLAEYVRHRLARTISTRYRDEQGRLHVVALDQAVEDRIAAGIEHSDRGLVVRMSPEAVELTCSRIAEAVKKLVTAGHQPLLLVNPRVRPGLRQMTANALPRLKILSYNEVTRDTQIESHGVVTDG
jgi:flagellar biosynthesis protein FlhA